MSNIIAAQNQPERRPPDAQIAGLLLDEAKAKAAAELAGLPELRSATTEAADALSAVLVYRLGAPEAVERAVTRNREGIEAAAEAAGLKIRTNRHDVLGAEAEARRAATARVVERTLGTLGDKAVELGNAAADSMTALDAAIEREQRKATTYLEAGTSIPLQDAIKERALLAEIEADGLTRLLARCESCARTEDVEELDRLLRVAKPLILKSCREHRSKVSARLGPSALPDQVEREIGAAWKLRDLLDLRARQRIPAEITTAISIRDRLLAPAFTILCGVSAEWMTRADFGGLIDNRTKVPERWAVDPSWYRREIDRKPWSPVR